MRTLKFYSEQEIQALKSAIQNNEKLVAASKRLSKEFKRSQGSVYAKLLELSNRIGKGKKRKNTNMITQPSERGVELKSGFVFDFKPQRAEMFKDHVRIYF
jgi:hypothetical protein